MLGDVALDRVCTLRIGDAGAEAEIGDACGKGFQAIEFNQIEVIGHAIDQMHRMRTALLGDLFQHRGERRQTGTTGEQQQRPLDFAQVKTAQRPGQIHAVAGLGQTGEKAAHQTAGHVANQKTDLAIPLQRAEGIGTTVFTARHLQVDVLPRQERQFAQRFALDRQRDGALGQLPDSADRRLKIGLFGFAHLRANRHAHHAIACGAHLAGQHITLCEFVGAQGVFDEVVAHFITPGFSETLTGAAGAVAAVQRDVDALAIRRVGDGFMAAGLDETSDAVFKIKGDLEIHGAPRRVD